jgi:DTW domain-containing protein YfiP
VSDTPAGGDAATVPSSVEPAPQEAAPIVENRVFVLILQHPQEQREPRATAAATVATLSRARLAAGLSWPNLARALGRPADPRRWGVLYLGSVRPAALSPDREVLLLGRNDEPVPDPAAILRNLDGVILLDGTWSQAKTLWWRNPWLLKLHRLVLNPAHPSRLGRLRREPRRDALSTIEAAALMLRHLEARPDAADALLVALGKVMAAARRVPQTARSA